MLASLYSPVDVTVRSLVIQRPMMFSWRPSVVSRSQGGGGELQQSPFDLSRRTSVAGGAGAPVVMRVCVCVCVCVRGRLIVPRSLKEEVPGQKAEPKETATPVKAHFDASARP